MAGSAVVGREDFAGARRRRQRRTWGGGVGRTGGRWAPPQRAGVSTPRRPGAPNPAGGFIGTEYVALIPNLQSGLTGTIRNLDVVEQPLVAPPPLPRNAEHHVAYTVDFPNRQAALYLDGVEVGRRLLRRR